MDVTLPLSSFLMGIMGSLHCAVMCGPLAGVLSAAPKGHAARGALLTQLGRLTTYAAFGAIAGAVGGAAGELVPPTTVRIVTRLMVAAVLLAVGLYLAGIVKGSGPGGGALGERLRRSLLGRLGQSPLARYARGLLWGTVPCGLVYGAAALALTAGSAPLGALSMATFFAGTLPAILTATWVARLLRTRSFSERLKRAVGVLLVASGGLHVALAALDSGAVRAPAEAPRPCCASHAHQHG
jgi:sulfite exporter TauE/SafE